MAAHTARTRRDPSEQAKLEAGLRDLFESKITFNQTLGLQVVSSAPQAPRIRFDMNPSFVGHHHSGRLHGGVISAALDATAGFALMCAIGERFNDESAASILTRFSRLGTIDLRIDYLRQGLGKQFVASAEVTRLGGRVGST